MDAVTSIPWGAFETPHTLFEFAEPWHYTTHDMTQEETLIAIKI